MLVPGFPNFALMAGPYSRLVANHAVVSEQQVHYLIELLQTMMDEDFAAVDVDEAACRAWVAEMDAGLANTTWVNCGNAHGYYRHASGKVIMAIPWHNTRIWHELRQPRLEDFVTTPREPGAKPEPLPADMLSI
jgi:hypothetical protein